MSSYTEKISDKINEFDSHKVFFTNDFLDIFFFLAVFTIKTLKSSLFSI